MDRRSFSGFYLRINVSQKQIFFYCLKLVGIRPDLYGDLVNNTSEYRIQYIMYIRILGYNKTISQSYKVVTSTIYAGLVSLSQDVVRIMCVIIRAVIITTGRLTDARRPS